MAATLLDDHRSRDRHLHAQRRGGVGIDRPTGDADRAPFDLDDVDAAPSTLQTRRVVQARAFVDGDGGRATSARSPTAGRNSRGGT